MSNIHGIGSYSNNNNNNNNNQGRRQPSGSAFPSSSQNSGQRLGGGGGGGNPNDQQNVLGFGGGIGGASPYPEMNKVLAPDFSKQRFIFWMSILQIIVFILELIIGQIFLGAAFCQSNKMGGPSTDTLKVMGGKYTPCIQNGEVYRFITPALLHAGILHIFTNLVSQTMIGYTCELNWGFWRMFAFYFITAFGATLLSTIGSPTSVSVGASGALLGIIGCYISWILLNWANDAKIRQPCQRLCTMIWWLVIIFMIGIGMPGIDNFAHLGGFITGVFIGFSFNEYTSPLQFFVGRMRLTRGIFIFLTVAYFATTLLITFMVSECPNCATCWSYSVISAANC